MIRTRTRGRSNVQPLGTRFSAADAGPELTIVYGRSAAGDRPAPVGRTNVRRMAVQDTLTVMMQTTATGGSSRWRSRHLGHVKLGGLGTARGVVLSARRISNRRVAVKVLHRHRTAADGGPAAIHRGWGGRETPEFGDRSQRRVDRRRGRRDGIRRRCHAPCSTASVVGYAVALYVIRSVAAGVKRCIRARAAPRSEARERHARSHGAGCVRPGLACISSETSRPSRVTAAARCTWPRDVDGRHRRREMLTPRGHAV